MYTFFAGGGAVKFVKDYAAAGLKKTIPLYGAGFLTDGTLEAQGADAEGLLTTLHYGDSLDTPRDSAFRLAYVKAYKLQPDVYAVQGYDAAQMLAIGLNAVKGDVSKKAEFAAARREGEDRQPARRVHARQEPQPGAGHLPAPGGGQGEQGDRRGEQVRWPTRAAAAGCRTWPPRRSAQAPLPAGGSHSGRFAST